MFLRSMLIVLLCGLSACQLTFGHVQQRANHASLSTPQEPTRMPRAEDLSPEHQPQEPFYKSWWFWSSIGVAVIVGAAVAVALSTGGTDRVAEGPDGRFDPQTFPSR
jgi:hypothetical protein